MSSSFLTIGSHRKLREAILTRAKVVRVVKLHRATFPGIDAFPDILELERCLDPVERGKNVYQFYDLWQFHPQTNKDDLATAYAAILADPGAQNDWPFADDVAKRYRVRQGALARYRSKPIFEGRASLYEFMADLTTTFVDLKLPQPGGQVTETRAQTIRGRHVVRLGAIAAIKIGLQSGNNTKFYRAAPGASGGAAKGGYKTVSMGQVLDAAALAKLTQDERDQGIEVDDPGADRYWVPLDKAGTSDIESGLLAEYWRPVEFYVDWSSLAVGEMKQLKGARFQNSALYFNKGISFSNTGVYSPTFRLGHGGVFDQTGSSIFCATIEPEVLLGILASRLVRYFVKSFINHGVHAQLDDVPVVIPDANTAAEVKALVQTIVTQQQADLAFDYRPLAAKIDELVEDLYAISPDERVEIGAWHRRHYPKLHQQPTPSQPTS